ncbi:hypothetical protein [Pseudoalteromonas sp. H105]|jgi:hypothetical protein|uniref:hypothetical protein n=1 Tax=Pseudoalteromonas sp. H105 TaxID=1348393 RepID=UPI000B08B697|nr:hypothetical protein [Pseudoalteromonas sp. H105]
MMKNTLLPSLVGVLASLFVVWWLHGFLLVDSCLDNSGTFNYETNLCMDENSQLIELTTSSAMLVTYCIVIMLVSLLTASLIRKTFKI